MEDDEEYKVGYGKPPRAHQFKKGHCANPKGRGNKKAPGAGELFVRVHAERIAAGTGTPIPRIQVVITQLSAAAAAGNLNAMEALIEMHTASAKGGDFRGDGVKRITDKSDRVVKVLELIERQERRLNGRRK